MNDALTCPRRDDPNEKFPPATTVRSWRVSPSLPPCELCLSILSLDYWNPSLVAHGRVLLLSKWPSEPNNRLHSDTIPLISFSQRALCFLFPSSTDDDESRRIHVHRSFTRDYSWVTVQPSLVRGRRRRRRGRRRENSRQDRLGLLEQDRERARENGAPFLPIARVSLSLDRSVGSRLFIPVCSQFDFSLSLSPFFYQDRECACNK